MQVKLKLMGVLKSKTPPAGVLDLPDESTIAAALRALEIPADAVQVFTVNGRLTRDPQHVLHPQDELTVLPPVGGG